MEIISDLDNFNVSFRVSCGIPSLRSFTNLWVAKCHQWCHQIPCSTHFCWTWRPSTRDQWKDLTTSDLSFQVLITPVCMSIDVHGSVWSPSNCHCQKKLSHRPVDTGFTIFANVYNVYAGILDLQTPEIMAWACRSAPVPHPHANETKDSHDLSRIFWHPNNEGHCKGQESGLLNAFPSDLVNFVHSMYILNHSDLFPTYRISFCIQVTSWIITNISSSGKLSFCPTVPSGTKCFDAF